MKKTSSTRAKFNCLKCGQCCKTVVINVGSNDILRWQKAGRADILREVSWLHNYPRKGTGGFYIIKTTFNPKQPCPFLGPDNLCAIQDIKPRACRDYPLSHDKAIPGCPASEIEGMYPAKRKSIKKSQHKDFKKAFFNQGRFMKILIEARR